MPLIHLDVKTIQQLIILNKKLIRELDTDKKYLEHITQLYWNSCDKINNGMLSTTAFECLNKAKGDLKVIKKQIKLLAELQYSLKYSIR